MENNQQSDLQAKIAAKKAEADAKKAAADAKKTDPGAKTTTAPVKKVEADAEKKADVQKKAVEDDVKKSEEAAKKAEKERPKVVLKNTSGKEVPIADYFFKGVVPAGFEGTCGKPVDREDLLTVFNKVFKPDDNILFYRQLDKEVYLVIVPLKYSVSVGDFEDSLDGDFQKHAISFLNEGSVNLDTLRQKLDKVTKFVKYTDR